MSFFYTEVAPGMAETLTEAFTGSQLFPNGLEFQIGELTLGEASTLDQGCVFKGRDNPWAGGYGLREDHFTVRVLLRRVFLNQPAPESALDPTLLEQAAQVVLDALKPGQEMADGYFVWYRTDYDNLRQIVDVQFITRQSNQFNTGG